MGKRPNATQGGSSKRSKAGKVIAPRVIAARALCKVADGGSLSEVLASTLPEAAMKDRPLVQELSYGVLRWWLRLQSIAQQLLEKPIKSKDRDLEMLILIGIYQLIYMRIPSHAAVAETVNGAKILGKSFSLMPMPLSLTLI